jgi:predicted tellurium resistance membrane protein TerC
MIIAGAALIMLVLDRLPILVRLGAMLLGWIAGEAIATDPAVHPILQKFDTQIVPDIGAIPAVFGMSSHVGPDGDLDVYICSILAAISVLVVGSIWRRRRLRHGEHPA